MEASPVLLSQQLMSFVQFPNDLNSKLNPLINSFVSDDTVIPSSGDDDFFAHSWVLYGCKVHQIIRWLNLLTITRHYNSLVKVTPDPSTYYPLQLMGKAFIVFCSKCNYDKLKKDGAGLEQNRDLLSFIDAGSKTLLMHLQQAEQEDSKERDEIGDLFIRRVDARENPVTPFISLFSSFFITFTGRGHGVLSLPDDLLGFTSFAKQAEAALLSLKEKREKENASSKAKRLRISGDVDPLYKEALHLHALFCQKVEQWNKSKTAAEKEPLRLELEMLKTQLVEKIAEASRNVIKTTKDIFDAERVCGVMHDAFSQLALYLHYVVPPSVDGVTLLDRYFLTTLSGIRLFYTFAIQQACLVILMNSHFHKMRTRHLLFSCRS